MQLAHPPGKNGLPSTYGVGTTDAKQRLAHCVAREVANVIPVGALGIK